MEMANFLKSTWLIVLLNLFALSALAQNVSPQTQKSPQLPPETVKKIEAVVEREMASQSIPGISIAVAVDSQLRYARGFGAADLENSVSAKATTVYRTASIAKPLTATAIMQLVEKGKLDLDTPIQKYCAAMPEKPWPITARLLLGHLSGIRHYQKPGESSGTEHYFTIEESMKIFKDDPLLHEPGTKHTYSTYGYSVLGCAIEGASGAPYGDYMQENVFRPAGMEHTVIDEHFFIIPNRARGYMKLNEAAHARLPNAIKTRVKVGQVLNAQLHDTSMKVPGGGLASTAVDLVNFGMAAIKGRLIKESTLQQMWTELKTKDNKDTGYGLGWGIGSVAGMRLISHSGGQAGTSTLLYLLPEKGVVLAAMSNLEGAALNRILNGIGKELITPSKP
jgi:CubicO group peptidase (beta-lactamase class C family)